MSNLADSNLYETLVDRGTEFMYRGRPHLLLLFNFYSSMDK